jgi:hypothetical protein
MMSTFNNLKVEIDKLKFDKRLTDGNLKRGTLTQEELKKHLAALPDSAANVEQIELGEDRGDAVDRLAASAPAAAPTSGFGGSHLS